MPWKQNLGNEIEETSANINRISNLERNLFRITELPFIISRYVRIVVDSKLKLATLYYYCYSDSKN